MDHFLVRKPGLKNSDLPNFTKPRADERRQQACGQIVIPRAGSA